MQVFAYVQRFQKVQKLGFLALDQSYKHQLPRWFLPIFLHVSIVAIDTASLCACRLAAHVSPTKSALSTFGWNVPIPLWAVLFLWGNVQDRHLNLLG